MKLLLKLKRWLLHWAGVPYLPGTPGETYEYVLPPKAVSVETLEAQFIQPRDCYITQHEPTAEFERQIRRKLAEKLICAMQDKPGAIRFERTEGVCGELRYAARIKIMIMEE
ncbi:MAG: hypothetical protein IJ206_09295 [Oscillospiraceae bacterium]|nr:hypothetical protein [Oscillospiraceae bacterium]